MTKFCRPKFERTGWNPSRVGHVPTSSCSMQQRPLQHGHCGVCSQVGFLASFIFVFWNLWTQFHSLHVAVQARHVICVSAKIKLSHAHPEGQLQLLLPTHKKKSAKASTLRPVWHKCFQQTCSKVACNNLQIVWRYLTGALSISSNSVSQINNYYSQGHVRR